MDGDSAFIISDDGKVGRIKASKVFFERNSVLTVAGKYSNVCWLTLDSVDDKTFEMKAASKGEIVIDKMLLQKMMNDLIDFQIRMDLLKEFGDLRKTIVNYAFSPVEGKNV